MRNRVALGLVLALVAAAGCGDGSTPAPGKPVDTSGMQTKPKPGQKSKMD